MNGKDFEVLMMKWAEDERGLIGLKGQDYSDGKDRLSNFKLSAEALGMTKYQIWAVYFKKHVDSVLGAIRDNPLNPDCKSEAIEGRLMDLAVYAKLMMALKHEDRLGGKEKVEPLTSLTPPTNHVLSLVSGIEEAGAARWGVCDCGWVSSIHTVELDRDARIKREYEEHIK